MRTVKQIVLWVVVGFFIAIAFWSVPTVSCISAIVIAALIIPIAGWQQFLKKYIRVRIKTIAIVALIILTVVTFPGLDTEVNADTLDSVAPNSADATEFAPKTVITTTTTATSDILTTHSTAVKSTTTTTTRQTTTSTAAPTTATPPIVTTTTQEPHTHTFIPATCTDPATCSCGVTLGEAPGHHWIDATDTSPKQCAVCGATEGAPLDNPNNENYHGHVYTGGASSKKYHYEERCAGKNSHEITWDEVSERGLTPCGKCVLK